MFDYGLDYFCYLVSTYFEIFPKIGGTSGRWTIQFKILSAVSFKVQSIFIHVLCAALYAMFYTGGNGEFNYSES
jgi:hypothetical protein